MINVNTNLQQLHQDLTNSGQAASGTPAQP
jgi:hypothetical protein